jgi:ATP-dependent DNA ligase
MARRDDNGVRLFTRNGYNFAARFPGIVAALESLSVRSRFIDGEAIVVDRNGLPVFDLLRYRQYDSAAVLCAFDLIELDGEDLRGARLEHRKRALAKLLRQKRAGEIDAGKSLARGILMRSQPTCFDPLIEHLFIQRSVMDKLARCHDHASMA